MKTLMVSREIKKRQNKKELSKNLNAASAIRTARSTQSSITLGGIDGSRAMTRTRSLPYLPHFAGFPRVRVGKASEMNDRLEIRRKPRE